MTPYFNLCPECGELFSKSKRTIKDYLRLICTHEKEVLESTIKLAQKGELTAAALQALIALEDCVRQTSGLKNLRGRDLMGAAFSFTWDSSKNKVTKKPKIAINGLKTESERNEQSGVQYIAIGLMAGPRNVLAHTHSGILISDALSIISAVSFVLDHFHRD